MAWKPSVFFLLVCLHPWEKLNGRVFSVYFAITSYNEYGSSVDFFQFDQHFLGFLCLCSMLLLDHSLTIIRSYCFATYHVSAVIIHSFWSLYAVTQYATDVRVFSGVPLCPKNVLILAEGIWMKLSTQYSMQLQLFWLLSVHSQRKEARETKAEGFHIVKASGNVLAWCITFRWFGNIFSQEIEAAEHHFCEAWKIEICWHLWKHFPNTCIHNWSIHSISGFILVAIPCCLVCFARSV